MLAHNPQYLPKYLFRVPNNNSKGSKKQKRQKQKPMAKKQKLCGNYLVIETYCMRYCGRRIKKNAGFIVYTF